MVHVYIHVCTRFMLLWSDCEVVSLIFVGLISTQNISVVSSRQHETSEPHRRIQNNTGTILGGSATLVS